MDGECQPFELAQIPSENGVTIGLSPDYVLVGGKRGANGGSAAIYIVTKASGEVKLTRPQRSDSSEPVRLFGTYETLVTIDQYEPANDARFLGHCMLSNCDDSVPAAGSFAFNNIRDCAFNASSGDVYWFDNATGELTRTSVDDWNPNSLGSVTVEPDDPNNYPKAVALDGQHLYGSFQYSIAMLPIDGSAAPATVSGYPAAESDHQLAAELATAPGSLLLLYPQSGNMYRVPLPDGIGNHEPSSIVGIVGATHMAVAGSLLFWSETSSLLSCALPLCSSSRTLAADRSIIWAVAADDAAVYWLSEPNDGAAVSVMRLAR